jgi:hypothetical protein
MRIYLDDDLDSNTLIRLLRRADHEAISPRAAGRRGVEDDAHLRYAAERGLVLLTANAGDFVELHRAWAVRGRTHAGILIVYRDNNPAKDMDFRQIALAVDRLAASGLALENQCFDLNSWKPPVRR